MTRLVFKDKGPSHLTDWATDNILGSCEAGDSSRVGRSPIEMFAAPLPSLLLDGGREGVRCGSRSSFWEIRAGSLVTPTSVLLPRVEVVVDVEAVVVVVVVTVAVVVEAAVGPALAKWLRMLEDGDADKLLRGVFESAMCGRLVALGV